MEGMRRRMMVAVFCAFVVSACSNAPPSGIARHHAA
jgi:hypothetical protein